MIALTGILNPCTGFVRAGHSTEVFNVRFFCCCRKGEKAPILTPITISHVTPDDGVEFSEISLNTPVLSFSVIEEPENYGLSEEDLLLLEHKVANLERR